MSTRVIVTVGIIYYRPDSYSNILQEFIWQTPDVIPQLTRVRRFLLYWKKNIIAPIKEVEISYSDNTDRTWRSIDFNSYLKME